MYIVWTRYDRDLKSLLTESTPHTVFIPLKMKKNMNEAEKCMYTRQLQVTVFSKMCTFKF